MNSPSDRGLKEEDLPMCVDCHGHGRHPLGRDHVHPGPHFGRTGTIHVNAVHGLAKAISDSHFEPDLWIISKDPEIVIRERHIRTKEQRFVSFLSEEGVTLLPTPAAKRDQPSLTDDQAREIGRIGLELERFLGFALSIEWALSKECRLFVLQCRPLTPAALDGSSQERAAPAGEALLQGGQLASPGTASGPVFIVKDNKDMLFFPEGAVLVTAIPHSRWSAVLPRAAAIVTEHRGAIFGHLANIAREFGIPALFALPGATTTLANGAYVTVDASGLKVLAAREQDIDGLPKPPSRSFASTTVHATLCSTMKEVDALTSVHPRPYPEHTSLREISLACRLEGCRHILSLAGLAGTIRPLAVKHPGDWWVLDLDDQMLGQGSQMDHLDISANSLLQAMWRGIELARWTAFTNTPHRKLMRLKRRLATGLTPLSAPRPRLFLLSEGMVQLHVSLDRGYLSVQAQTGELAELNSAVLVWHWSAMAVPTPDMVQAIAGFIGSRGFQVEVACDGLLAWAVGCSGQEIAARASFLAFMPELMLSDGHREPAVPLEIDLNSPTLDHPAQDGA
jgi:pyruvate, water dikinase